jgi:hypothetical protein
MAWVRLVRPIVGMASTPDGAGYWLVASDGGVFSFGDAGFFGSTGGVRLVRPIVGMASTPDGAGYWLVASDGGVFSFGDAPFDGSLASSRGSIAGISAVTGGTGYELLSSDGAVSQFDTRSSSNSFSSAYIGIGPAGSGSPTIINFPGTTLDSNKWVVYTASSPNTNGTRSASAVGVADGDLLVTDSGSTTGGLCYCAAGESQLYGHWEIRASVQPGDGYDPVIILWPKGEVGPATNEIDIAELPDGARSREYTTVHGASGLSQQESQVGDFTSWHTYGVDWGPDHVTFLLDGHVLWTTTNPAEVPHVPMFLALQEDMGPVPDWVPPVDSTTPSSVTFRVASIEVWPQPAKP